MAGKFAHYIQGLLASGNFQMIPKSWVVIFGRHSGSVEDFGVTALGMIIAVPLAVSFNSGMPGTQVYLERVDIDNWS